MTVYAVYREDEDLALFDSHEKAVNYTKELSEVKWELEYHKKHGYWGEFSSPEAIVSRHVQEMKVL